MRKENSKTEVKDWNSGRFALCIPVFLCYNFFTLCERIEIMTKKRIALKIELKN